MTTRARVVLGLFIFSLLGAFATGQDLYFNLAYLWGGLLLISYLWSRFSLHGVRLERQPRSLRAQVGRTFEEKFILENRSRILKLWVEIRDNSNLPGHRASAVFSQIEKGRKKVWVVRSMCVRRGRYRLGPAELHSGDPFGLFPRTITIAATHYLVVLPKMERITSLKLKTGRLPGGQFLRLRTHKITPNAAGVRDYAPGDSLNRIHWKSTARRQRLIVKEFEFDPRAEVWIVLDAQEDVHAGHIAEVSRSLASGLTYGDFKLPKDTEEYAVAIAASLALYFYERDRELGFICHGRARHMLQSDRGEAQLLRILESLAMVEAKGANSLSATLKVEGSRIARGASVIIVTPSVEKRTISIAQELMRTGSMPMLLLIDALSFGGRSGSENLVKGARSLGIPVWLIRYGDSIAQSFSQQKGQERWIPAA